MAWQVGDNDGESWNIQDLRLRFWHGKSRAKPKTRLFILENNSYSWFEKELFCFQ